jgi:hypothetical protein
LQENGTRDYVEISQAQKANMFLLICGIYT